ncbi:MAG: autotransporter domain-containing protein [Chthoniobacterales bacterium]|nr:autotransporter domain-containing protein [Chthoniobacterales bacterium]
MGKNQITLVLSFFFLFLTRVLLAQSSNLYVGSNTPNNTTNFTSGTNSYANTYIGYDASSTNNNLGIFNLETVVNSLDSLCVGVHGSYNSLIISNGGTLISRGNAFIGQNSDSSNNQVIITGIGSFWNVSATNNNGNLFGDLFVGCYGSGNSMIISNGGTLISKARYNRIGRFGSNNKCIITGMGSFWSNSSSIILEGTNNELVISNQGRVIAQFLYLSGRLDNCLITDNDSSLNAILCDIGSGNSNTLVISNGGKLIDQIGFIARGNGNTNNNVLVTGSGSLWSNTQYLQIGGRGNNSLVLSNGGVVSSQNAYLGRTGVSNTALITGLGSLWSNSSMMTIGGEFSGAEGTLTLAQEGMLYVGSNLIIASGSNTTGTLNFGTFGGSDAAGALSTPLITLGPGAATINYNQTNTLSITSTITGNGTIQQLGSGITIMSGNNTYSGTTVISYGILETTNDNALGESRVVLDSGATLQADDNLLISQTLSWNSGGMIAAGSGSNNLSVNTIDFVDGTNGLYSVAPLILSHGLIKIADWTNQIGTVNINNFTTPDSGVGLILSNNAIYARVESGTNLVVASSTMITNTLYVNDTVVTNTGGMEPTVLDITTAGTLISSNFTTAYSNTILLVNGTETTPITTIEQGAASKGNGTINGNVANNGTVSPGDAITIGTLTVNGNYVQTITGTLGITITSEGCSQLIINGFTTLGGNVRFNISDNAARNYGTAYQFLTSPDPIDGTFETITCSNTNIDRIRLVYNPDPNVTAYLAPASYTLVAQNQNQTNVATALNTFIPATSGDELTVSTALDQLTTSQYPTAFNQIMPTLYQSLSTIAFNQANANNMELIQRLWGARIAEEGGFSMGGFGENMPLIQEPSQNQNQKKEDILRSENKTPWGVFIDGSGIFAQANSGNMLPSYNTESGGVTTGLTYRWNDHMVSGIYSGYQGDYTKYNGSTSGNLIGNTVRFGLFGTYGQEKEKGFFIDGLIGGDYSGYTMQRNINFSTINRTATGNPGAGELDSMVATGYDFKKGNWTYGPTMNLQYAYFGVPSFNETGAQSLDLQNVSWNTSSMIYSLGSHVAYRWEVNKQLVLVPQINLSWQHEFLQNSYDISANLGGINFYNSSSAPLRDTLYTGIGCSLEFAKKWDTSFFYNAAAGNSDLMSQNIFLSLGMRF